MSSSALASLEYSLNVWEWIAFISTAIVLIGVAAEAINEFTHWFRRLRVHKRLGKASTFLVVAGIFVELLSLVMTTRLSGRVIEDLKFKTEQERLARMKIEDRLEWRTFGVAQYGQLKEALAKYPGQSAVMLWSDTDDDREPSWFAGQLHDLLQDALWRAPVRLPEGEVPPIACGDATGILVGVADAAHAGQKVVDAANDLVSGLRADIRDVTLRPGMPSSGSERIVILVCPRPRRSQ